MNNVIVYWLTMVCYSKIFFVLAHKFTNIPTESIADKNQNLLIKQEPGSTYNIDLP